MTCQNGADDGSAPWMTIGGRQQAEGQWKGSVGSDEHSRERVDPLQRERGGVIKRGSGRGEKEELPRAGWLEAGFFVVSRGLAVCASPRLSLEFCWLGVRGRTAGRPASLSCSYLGARTGSLAAVSGLGPTPRRSTLPGATPRVLVGADRPGTAVLHGRFDGTSAPPCPLLLTGATSARPDQSSDFYVDTTGKPDHELRFVCACVCVCVYLAP